MIRRRSLRALGVIRTLGERLVSGRVVGDTLNRGHVPLGMLDIERITRVPPPVSTITHRPLSTVLPSTSTKV